jgi:phytoene desaturase
VAVDPACSYRFADGTRLDMPHDPAAVPAALDAALGAGAGASWEAFHRHAARLWELCGDTVLRRPVSVPALVGLTARASALRTIAPWRSLDDLGAARLPDPRLRTWLRRYATYSGSDPRRAPSVLAVTAYVEQHFGSWYVRGGLRRVADALLERCRELGVAVHLGSEVTAVRTRGRRTAGVRLGCGREVDAPVVVCDADAEVLFERLLPARRAVASRLGLRRRARSYSGFVVLLTLDRGEPVPAHRVWFPQDYTAEFDALFARRPAPVAEPAIYVHAPDDPGVPPDREGWFVLVNAPRQDPSGGVDWDAPGLADSYADHVLDLLAERGADVRGRVRERIVRTPADLERGTAAPGGTIYGSASHGARAALRRPANRTAVRGLYLVGGSAHPGGGIPLVLLSAEIVAGLIGPAGPRTTGAPRG